MAKKKKVEKTPVQHLIESLETLGDFIANADAGYMENYLNGLDEEDINRIQHNVDELENILSK